jgi:hypothetical protein
MISDNCPRVSCELSQQGCNIETTDEQTVSFPNTLTYCQLFSLHSFFCSIYSMYKHLRQPHLGIRYHPSSFNKRQGKVHIFRESHNFCFLESYYTQSLERINVFKCYKYRSGRLGTSSRCNSSRICPDSSQGSGALA